MTAPALPAVAAAQRAVALGPATVCWEPAPRHRLLDGLGLAEQNERAARAAAQRYLTAIIGPHGAVEAVGDVEYLRSEDCAVVTAVVRVWVPVAEGER